MTHDVTDQCDSDFLSEVGKRTPVATRFSTVVHERGSPESLRDVRGFSVKFYTQQGNWDFVGELHDLLLHFCAHFCPNLGIPSAGAMCICMTPCVLNAEHEHGAMGQNVGCLSCYLPSA